MAAASAVDSSSISRIMMTERFGHLRKYLVRVDAGLSVEPLCPRESFMHGNSSQPGDECGMAFELLQMLVRPDVSLLHDVFRNRKAAKFPRSLSAVSEAPTAEQSAVA